MIFVGTTETPSMDLGSLAENVKPTVTDLGVKVDSDLKLDHQLRALVKSSFFFSNEAVGQN